MENVSKFPALKAAIEFISGNIEKGVWKQGDRLPSIRLLAQQTGISTPTICKAIARLKSDKVLGGNSHHRTYVGELPREVPPEAGALQQWQQKRIVLEQELLSGALGHLGVLPTFKEFQARYGIGYRTIKKIVRAMLDDGVIVPQGKGYALPGVPVQPTRRRIVYVTIQNHESQRSAINQEHNRVIDAFESECVSRRLYFEIAEINFYDTAAARLEIARLSNADSTEGFILDVWWYTNPNVQQGYGEALSRLATFKKPVALLDEIGTFELPIQFARNALIQVYRIESKRAGERMARFLVELGHKSAVFISLFRDTAWSVDRYEGVCAQFSRAGHATGVHAATETGDVAIANVLTVSGLSDEDVRTFMRVGRTSSQVIDMEKNWAEFKRGNKPPYPGLPRLNAGMRRNLEGLIALARHGKEALFFERTFAGALDAMVQWLLPVHLHPCLEKALAYKEATVWICANDAFGMAAIAFLRSRGIRVPQDISVTGFDNIPVHALEAGLTTFDFNTPAFINRMLNFIIRPPRPRGAFRHSPIEIEGIIMERKSTARIR